MNDVDQVRDEYNRLKINRDAIAKQLRFARDELHQKDTRHEMELTRTYYDGLITGVIVSVLCLVLIFAATMSVIL